MKKNGNSVVKKDGASHSVNRSPSNGVGFNAEPLLVAVGANSKKRTHLLRYADANIAIVGNEKTHHEKILTVNNQHKLMSITNVNKGKFKGCDYSLVITPVDGDGSCEKAVSVARNSRRIFAAAVVVFSGVFFAFVAANNPLALLLLVFGPWGFLFNFDKSQSLLGIPRVDQKEFVSEKDNSPFPRPNKDWAKEELAKLLTTREDREIISSIVRRKYHTYSEGNFDAGDFWEWLSNFCKILNHEPDLEPDNIPLLTTAAKHLSDRIIELQGQKQIEEDRLKKTLVEYHDGIIQEQIMKDSEIVLKLALNKLDAQYGTDGVSNE